MLDVDGLRGHVTTDLDDEALGLLLDAAYEAIDDFAGDQSDTITERITPGPGDIVMLSRPADSVVSITEYETDLAADDYELIGGQMLRRLSTGTTGGLYWHRRLYVTYIPTSNESERDRVAAALVQLDLDTSPGVQSERLGDWAVTNESTGDYAKSRAAILASLSSGFIAA